MSKLAISLCGEGRGHATRATAVVRRLEQEHDILIWTSSDALDFLRRQFAEGHPRVRVEEIPGILFQYSGGRLDVMKSITAGLDYQARQLGPLVDRMMRELEDFGADLAITDFEPALPRAAGRRVTGRDCRFMVTLDEMIGLQGWFLQRLGCFPVNPRRPTAASLRLAVELLEDGQQLVVFPEGRIMQDDGPLRLMQGLARLTALAEGQGVAVPVVPVGIGYSHGRPRLGGRAALCFGAPLRLEGTEREHVAQLNAQLLDLRRVGRAREGVRAETCRERKRG